MLILKIKKIRKKSDISAERDYERDIGIKVLSQIIHGRS